MGPREQQPAPTLAPPHPSTWYDPAQRRFSASVTLARAAAKSTTQQSAASQPATPYMFRRGSEVSNLMPRRANAK
jgi:hypothetical protein